MKVIANVEIHFHQQDEVSVYLEIYSSNSENDKFGEIVLFCCTAIRMMSNMGRNNYTDTLAKILKSFDNDDYFHLMFKDFVKHDSPRTAKLVEYMGNEGRKRFLVNAIISDEKTGFDFKAKGFGIFAKGMNYYGPTAILSLLKFLVKKHIDGPQGVRGRNSDNTRLREVLGWEPEISLEEGIARTYAWIEEQVKEKMAHSENAVAELAHSKIVK